MPAPRPARTASPPPTAVRLLRCQTDDIPLPLGPDLPPLHLERWVVRTPQGLILADWREPNSWRVSAGGPGCRVYVPDYAPAQSGYRLCLEDDSGNTHAVSFDVAAP